MYKTLQCFLFAFGLVYAQCIEANQSSIDEFNEAFPLSAEVQSALELIGAVIPAKDNNLKQFKNRYASKLELRAFACAQFLSKEEVDPKKIEAITIKRNECLKAQDEQILQFIGMSLVGFRSMQPSLRPLLKLGAPIFIPNKASLRIFTGIAASKSGVAVLTSGNEFASFEIPSGKEIANLPRMPNASLSTAVLSPNGRITVIRNGNLSFIDNETGQELWQAKKFGDFYAWFPEMQAALVSRTINGDSKLWLLDFKTGEIVPYSIPYKGQSWALQISESPSCFLIGSPRGDFSLVENNRTSAGVVGKIVQDYKLAKNSVISGSPILMQNGKSILFRSFLGPENDFFTLFNLNSGEEKLFDTNSFLSKNGYAKLDDETLLVYSPSDNNNSWQPWAFNIKNSELSAVNNDDVKSYILSGIEGRVGFMSRDHDGMWIGGEVRVGKPLSLSSVVAARKVERDLTTLENEAYYKNDKAGSFLGFESQIAEKRAQIIGSIPSNAQTQAIGVIQGKNDGTYRTVNVTVRKTRKPLVLMLNSYSALRWNLIKESGANLVAVIVTSYEGTKILGAGDTKTILRKGNYANWAYEHNSPEYTVLNNDAVLWTGKPISKFQGKYEGDSFSVGD